MSEATVRRWNAIPLARQDKRSRSPSDKDDDSDDDVSLVSRSPSPELKSQNITEYDSMVRGIAREIITIETKISSNNVGHKLLAKMGWKDGQGLGPAGEGRADPIPFELKLDSTGIGKGKQDFKVIAMTASQRRDMASERQIKETGEERRKREETVAKKAAIKSEIVSFIRPFYCALCDKQYTNVTQYDEHVRSYAHTHKQRFKDMEASQKPKDTSKAREKERKREEKELKRLAAASGIKLARPPASAATVAAVVPTPTLATVEGGFKKKDGGGFKSSGWAAVSSGTPPAVPTPSSSGGGWSRVGAPSTAPNKSSTYAPIPIESDHPPPPPPPTDDPAAPPPPSNPLPHSAPPMFRRSGFTKLDTTITEVSQPIIPSAGGWAPIQPPSAPAPLPDDAPPPLPSGPSTSSRWATVSTAPVMGRPTSDWTQQGILTAPIRGEERLKPSSPPKDRFSQGYNRERYPPPPTSTTSSGPPRYDSTLPPFLYDQDSHRTDGITRDERYGRYQAPKEDHDRVGYQGRVTYDSRDEPGRLSRGYEDRGKDRVRRWD